MPRFRTLSVEVDAVEWTGDNATDVIDFLGPSFAGLKWVGADGGHHVIIRTPERRECSFEAPIGWWMVRGTSGKHYACEPSMFANAYEPVAAGS